MSEAAISTPASRRGTLPAVELGIRVHLRDVTTLDDAGDVQAPPPVELGDVVASAEAIWRVEVVLVTPPGARCIPVLARRIELADRRALTQGRRQL